MYFDYSFHFNNKIKLFLTQFNTYWDDDYPQSRKSKIVQSFNLDEGISWQIGSQNRNEKNIEFWIGKRAQSGKKVPKRFNKNLKFYD